MISRAGENLEDFWLSSLLACAQLHNIVISVRKLLLGVILVTIDCRKLIFNMSRLLAVTSYYSHE